MTVPGNFVRDWAGIGPCAAVKGQGKKIPGPRASPPAL